jgi:hypothetical protein
LLSVSTIELGAGKKRTSIQFNFATISQRRINARGDTIWMILSRNGFPIKHLPRFLTRIIHAEKQSTALCRSRGEQEGAKAQTRPELNRRVEELQYLFGAWLAAGTSVFARQHQLAGRSKA